MAKKELDRFDTKAKKDIQILAKLLALIGAAVIGSCVSVEIIAILIFDRGLMSETRERIEHTADGVDLTLKDWTSTLKGYALTLSERPDIVEALETGEKRTLQNDMTNIAEDLEIDILAVTDARGNVAGGYGVSANANVSSAFVVTRALQGSVAKSFEGLGNVVYAALSAAPIRAGGRIIGCVIAGYDFTKNDFVEVVQDSYNMDSTILKEDVRMSSTLLDENGKSLVGTKISNAEVVQQVLRNGNPFEGETKINGQAYYAIYHPLRGDDGKVTGMVFIAESLKSMERIKKHTIAIVSPIVAVIVIVLMIIAYRFVHWLMWRIYNVTNFLKEMETGNADLTKRCKLFIRDEIGDLIIHFDAFLDKLQQIVSEIKGSKDELTSSGRTMAASTQETSSAITQIIANIDSIHGQITSQSGNVHDTAGAVNEVASNIESLERMIENQGASVSQASTAVEEMVGNIKSVNQSVDRMANSFNNLEKNAQIGFTQQEDVNERIKQSEKQSKMLQEANQAISNIAEQTNLLAMNAAIEAAHAGEAGKGFSVVADEIRKLSETSSAQSKTIGEQLNKIKESISEVVSASAASSEAFSAMSTQIKETDELVAQIKAAMEEQNQGSRQISEALHSMNDSTTQVHNAATEMTAGNRAILENVRTLQDSTTAIDSSMEEMSNGARKINETGTALAEIARTVHEAIEKIGAQVDLFKV